MYMFFWFFKQLYYCLRRIFKSGILLLIVFFIAFLFIFIKPCFASTTIEGFDYNGSHYTFPEPITINNNNNSYVLLSYDNMTSIRVIEPYDTNGTLITLTVPSVNNYANTNNINSIRSFYNGSLAPVYYYDIPYTDNTFGTWSTYTVNNFYTKFKNDSHTIDFITISNLNTYTDITGIFNNTNLPNNIHLYDNILLLYKGSINELYLLYTTNSNNYFNIYNSTQNVSCFTSTDITAHFDIYKYNVSNSNFDLLSSNVTSYTLPSSSNNYIRYSTNDYKYNSTLYNFGFHNIFGNPDTEPFIETNSSSIINWSFNNLVINCGSINPDSTFYLDCDYEGYTFSYDDLEQFTSVNNGTAFITIPKSFLSQNIVIRNGFNFAFNLKVSTPQGQLLYYNLGSYTMSLTTQEEEQLNQDSDKQVLSDISNNQKETTQAVENLENTVTDSTLQDDSVFFPTLDVPDLARDGLTHIFDAFVLAFCSNTPEDIILPIPYTNKSITIPYNYTREMLTNYSPNLLNLITLFWWYWIARIIVFDIYDKMDKLQSGDVENLQKENVTTNML